MTKFYFSNKDLNLLHFISLFWLIGHLSHGNESVNITSPVEGYYALFGVPNVPQQQYITPHNQFIGSNQQLIAQNISGFTGQPLQSTIGYYEQPQPQLLHSAIQQQQTEQLWISSNQQQHMTNTGAGVIQQQVQNQVTGHPLYLIQSTIPPLAQLRIESPIQDTNVSLGGAQQVLLVSDPQQSQQTTLCIQQDENSAVNVIEVPSNMLLIPTDVQEGTSTMTIQVPQPQPQQQFTHNSQTNYQPVQHQQQQIVFQDPTNSSTFLISNKNQIHQQQACFVDSSGGGDATLVLLATPDESGTGTALVPAVVQGDGSQATLILSGAMLTTGNTLEELQTQENRTAAPQWASDSCIASKAMDAFSKRARAKYHHTSAGTIVVSNASGNNNMAQNIQHILQNVIQQNPNMILPLGTTMQHHNPHNQQVTIVNHTV